MSLSDPIGDMIARVKNAQARSHKKVELPSSNFKTKIADILKNEGFIKNFKVSSEEKKPILSLELKYHSGNPVISAFERVSKPGRRIFSSADSLPKINNGLGIAIVSTPKGVMTDIDARKHKKVELPSSNFKTKIADILKNEGFIKDFKVSSEDKKPILSLELKYHSGNPVISAFERVSKPGRRIFSSADSLPKINNGLGIAIVSTPKGVMTDIDARKQKVGGEIICKVF